MTVSGKSQGCRQAAYSIPNDENLEASHPYPILERCAEVLAIPYTLKRMHRHAKHLCT